ncbi:catechol 2,3-dioxygenase-like lactoylglutathione lyase family enzyme [Streptacidiphilus sp. MAP12-20]|uniref:VOC family protein n=1 Tax=Streptacidiphilus sp. MAP12-20 TaxID=3156299 RepID=UPI0035145FD7
MTLPARISIVTLGVSDLQRSIEFYQDLGWPLSSESQPGTIAWFRTADSVLGLFPSPELAADAGVPDDGEPTFRGVTLAVNLGTREEVDAAMAAALAVGADLVKAPTLAEWGGYSGYFADPDGHLWELCHNPGFPLTAEGRLDLPV